MTKDEEIYRKKKRIEKLESSIVYDILFEYLMARLYI